MASLIQNMSRHDVQWAKFKHSYMYNKIYYLRRTKFIVYQLATNIIGIGSPIGIAVLKQYKGLQKTDIPGFPNARLDTSDFVSSFAFNTFSSVSIGLFFGAAVFFDLFWPEREEAPCIQWTWKLTAAATSVFQLAASLATTIIVTTHSVHIHGVSVEQQDLIRGDWKGPHLAYRKNERALATVTICWIGCVLTIWSTILVWRSYAHNNIHGPFADHNRNGNDRETLSGAGLGHI